MADAVCKLGAIDQTHRLSRTPRIVMREAAPHAMRRSASLALAPWRTSPRFAVPVVNGTSDGGAL